MAHAATTPPATAVAPPGLGPDPPLPARHHLACGHMARRGSHWRPSLARRPDALGSLRDRGGQGRSQPPPALAVSAHPPGTLELGLPTLEGLLVCSGWLLRPGVLGTCLAKDRAMDAVCSEVVMRLGEQTQGDEMGTHEGLGGRAAGGCWPFTQHSPCWTPDTQPLHLGAPGAGQPSTRAGDTPRGQEAAGKAQGRGRGTGGWRLPTLSGPRAMSWGCNCLSRGPAALRPSRSGHTLVGPDPEQDPPRRGAAP